MNKVWSKKIEEKFSYLIQNENFQKDIQQLRGKWHIPSTGLKSNFDADESNWHVDLYKKTDIYFQKMRRSKQSVEEINKNAPLNIFNSDLENLAKKYNMSHHKDFFRSYLLFNIHTIPSSVTIVHHLGKDPSEEKLYIEITPETTLPDIVEDWKRIQSFQEWIWKKDSQKRQKISPKYERNIMVP